MEGLALKALVLKALVLKTLDFVWFIVAPITITVVCAISLVIHCVVLAISASLYISVVARGLDLVSMCFWWTWHRLQRLFGHGGNVQQEVEVRTPPPRPGPRTHLGFEEDLEDLDLLPKRFSFD